MVLSGAKVKSFCKSYKNLGFVSMKNKTLKNTLTRVKNCRSILKLFLIHGAFLRSNNSLSLQQSIYLYSHLHHKSLGWLIPHMWWIQKHLSMTYSSSYLVRWLTIIQLSQLLLIITIFPSWNVSIGSGLFWWCSPCYFVTNI